MDNTHIGEGTQVFWQCIIAALLLYLIYIWFFDHKEGFINYNILTDEYRALERYNEMKRYRDMISRGLDRYGLPDTNLSFYNNYYDINSYMARAVGPYASQSRLVGYIRKPNDGMSYSIMYDGFRDKFFAQPQNDFMPVVEIKSPDLIRNLDVSRKNKITITNGIMKGKYLFQADELFRY